MSTITLRSTKGSPLTNNEVDANFTNLNTDKYESGNNAAFGTLDASGLASLDAGIDVNGSLFTVDTSGNTATVNLTTTGDHTASITAAVTAAGTDQSGATALTKTFNVVTTATANQGVKLPTAAAGLRYNVVNGTSVNVKIYPNTSGTINSGTANAAIDLPAGATAQLIGTTATNWNTMVETVIYDSSGTRLN